MTAATMVAFDDDPTLPCRTTPGAADWFFADADNKPENKRAVEAAKALCVKCPRRAECLARALKAEDRYGIFGGYTPAERAAMLRQVRARGERPTPPELGKGRGKAGDTVRLRRLFDAARLVVDGGQTRRAAAVAAGVNLAILSEVVMVLRWAPDVAGEVEAGRMALAPALRYAKQVAAWEQLNGVAA